MVLGRLAGALATARGRAAEGRDRSRSGVGYRDRRGTRRETGRRGDHGVPDTIWIRLELSLLFEKEPEDPDLPLTIQQDIMAYVRTVKLVQVQGASGYQHFKSDILERARIRSKGIVKDVLVRTMIFE